MFGDTFYPTPKPLIKRMIGKIQLKEPWGAKVLEPSAGKGDIVEALTDEFYGERRRSAFHRDNISTIEINEDLQAMLRGNRYRVIDSDFLSFAGPDKFDLIIANPPFDTGEQHLLKAIDVMYCGEIIFLLNAETLKNPYTNTRKELVKRLAELNADIEYIQDAFINAERPTGVEIALIHIVIERHVEEDIFNGTVDADETEVDGLETDYEVSNRKPIQELVAEYNQIVTIGTETIIGYFKNYKKIGQYIGLNKEADKYVSNGDMTAQMQSQVNDLLVATRTCFWRRVLALDDVKRRMTQKRLDEFEHRIKCQCHMDFTEFNIRQFILNLIHGYEDILTQAVLEIFEKFTVAHSYSGGLYEDNIHYFSGWKTNNAFKVGKKVIIPVYGGYGKGPFIDDYNGKWKMAYDVPRMTRDIDVTMSHFDGMNNYYAIHEALEHAFTRGESRKIHSTYFTITAYKKGTLHLVFNDEDILRRFNVAACRGKNWLPHEYGSRPYQDMKSDEKAVVDSFEGVESYNEHLNQPVFARKELKYLLT